MEGNTNFIPASELPTTEATEVDVLCVEHGELKRKDGASLGGVKYDAIISINSTDDTLVLESGDYASLKAKIENGEFPRVLIRGTWTYGETYPFVAEGHTVLIDADSGNVCIETHFLWYDHRFHISSDGTVDVGG